MRWLRAAGMVALVGLTSCYDWVAIKPTEIPRFAAAHEVDGPDGLVRFEGKVAVKVHTPMEGTLTYWNPRAKVEDGWLVISGESAPPAEIPLGAIDRAKAGQLNAAETVATIVVSLAGAATLIVLYKNWFDQPARGQP